MKILAIETSCDETSIAIIEKLQEEKEGVFVYKILAHETNSQINLHREFGGVYPTLSRREHEKNLIPLLHKVLKDSDLLKEKTQEENMESFSEEVTIKDDNLIVDILKDEIELLERYPDLKDNVFDFFTKYELKEKIDYIAVTNGPGLPPALWVGVNFAKVVSILFGKENFPISIYPINHLEGHIIGGISERFTNESGENLVTIPKIDYPAVGLLISGGHTELVLSEMSGKYTKLGETQDDATGEAYDKVARLLGLPYPGGPEIGRLAKQGREAKVESLNFPRPMIHSKDLNFSFSGLKTHVLYFVQNLTNSGKGLDEEMKTQIATEFEESVKDVLISKSKRAIEETGAQTFIVGGGVAANTYLKENFKILASDLGIQLKISEKELSTDNALMIALTCANQIENNVEPTKEFIAIGSKNYNW